MGVQVAAHTLHLALDFGNNLKFVITTGYLLLPAIKKIVTKRVHLCMPRPRILIMTVNTIM